MPVLIQNHYRKMLPSRIITTSLIGRQIVIMVAIFCIHHPTTQAQRPPLDQTLLQENIQLLAKEARQKGIARRGALLFHSPGLGCWKCHAADSEANLIGPVLSEWTNPPSDVHLVESILDPSKVIADSYRAKQWLTVDGENIVGIPIEVGENEVIVRTGPGTSDVMRLANEDIEANKTLATSIMPSGQVNVLQSRQDFLDLVGYLIEISEGGPATAAKLEPTEKELLAFSPSEDLNLDHSGIIRDWNKESYQRGQEIYQRVCQNCHGTLDTPGSLPTSLRFAEGRFKYGSDPLSMYQTLSHGGGMMLPQTWMVPQQKYDVIHYIREHFLSKNPSQYYAVSEAYLSSLPKGDSRGPAPQVIEPWVTMDYGPMLITTIQFGPSPEDIAQKAIAIRVDNGPGGIARGKAWMAFEHDTLRMAAAWTDEFVDWNGIQFNGRHGVHLRAKGNLIANNPNAAGWSDPSDRQRVESARTIGRDNREYGPLPKDWGQFRGIYRHQDRVILDYKVGSTFILEYPNLVMAGDSPIFVRTLETSTIEKPLEVIVLTMREGDAAEHHADGFNGDRVSVKRAEGKTVSVALSGFRGQGSLLVRDQQVIARIRPTELGCQGSILIGDAKWNQQTKMDIAEGLQQLPESLKSWTQGGPAQYATSMKVPARRWFESETWEVEEIARPENNPWLARTRVTGMDFSPTGDSLVACTWDGDIWRVDNLEQLGKPDCSLTWTRIATGLFQPLGILWEDHRLLVTCRDQIVALKDKNGDGEMDHYECFNSDHQVTEHFHEFAMGLQRNTNGDYFYAKSARHALKAVVPHHGTLLRVASNGDSTDIIATGFRAANGVCLNDDGTFIVTDQEGHWNPKNRINWVREGGFYGNMYGYHDVTDERDEAMDSPLCWITNAFDRSPAELVWAKTDQWGGLNGKLLNLSYGYGRIYVVPHEFISPTSKPLNGKQADPQPQGGMCALPIPDLPTGMIRGRFSPRDGQLYVGGMFSWAGSRQEQEGGLFRVRYRGGPHQMPSEIKAMPKGIKITFTEPLDHNSATDRKNYEVKTWDLRRTKNYGSPHVNEKRQIISAVNLLEDRCTVQLQLPELDPTRGMEIICHLKDREGNPFKRVIHNTIYGFNEQQE